MDKKRIGRILEIVDIVQIVSIVQIVFNKGDEYLEENPALYKLIDLTDPSAPTSRFFLAESELMAIINDTTAVGRTYRYNVVSVLSGDFISGFKTVSIVTEYPIEFGGYAPPYFIIAERLWKFEEQ